MLGPFAIIGHPVGKSMSPRLFCAAYPQLPPGTYLVVEADRGQTAMHKMETLGIRAANITMPLKTDCIPCAQQVSDQVLQTNATNLLRKENGTWSAWNTDVTGVSESFRATGVTLAGRQALVLGAGGAGRAAALALEQAGARVFIANRTPREGLCSLDSVPDLLAACSVVVNTSPVAQKEELLRNLTKNHTVLDASYTQAPAKKATLQAGACYLSGYHWLYHQAVEGFQIMTGLEPDTGAMRRLLGL